MGEITAGLDGKTKSRWSRVFPAPKSRRSGQTIKAIVDLHRVEIPPVVVQHEAGRKIGRIVGSAPMGVMPSGGPDPHNSHLITHVMHSFDAPAARSEERRVGKECRSRWSPYH